MASEIDTDQLLKQARSGIQSAREALLEKHRRRLKRMIAVHLDKRLASRADPSDVVQETIMVANHRIDKYLQQPVIPFYPWLRQLAWNQIQLHHRRHLGSLMRSVNREELHDLHLPEHSSVQLAQILTDQPPSPISRMVREEALTLVRTALERLKPAEREVLVLRFLEQLSVDEAAEVLEISNEAVKMRQLRAIRKLRRLQEDIQ